jgi:hypothetical protein
MKLFGITWMILLILSVSCSQTPVIETHKVLLQFNDNLNGIKSMIDKRTGRQFASGIEYPIYSISYGDDKSVDSKSADRYSYKKTDNGLELYFWHEKEINLKVTCKVQSKPADSLIYWSIEIENSSDYTVTSVEYPQISCIDSLGKKAKDDAIVFPIHEGELLTKMNVKGAKAANRYPGQVSAQLMYYFDPTGGFYYASSDGNGYPKNIKVINNGKGIVLSQEYLLPVQFEKEIKMPYEVVTGCFGGRWEDGAGVYREWSDKQAWTRKTISQRKSPSWLKGPNFLINPNFGSKRINVEMADQMIKGYHDYFDIPVIAAVFGWEKHGTWIGPDYFPPNPGKKFYIDLVRRLEKRGDHLYFYTSGFRWGVKKPISERVPGKYTSYDGTQNFMKNGKEFAITSANNELVLLKPRWADNYILCAGSEGARNILDSCYNYIYNLGVAGVDLDQNIGGEVSDCYNTSHGHPKGSGLWQTQAIEKFFSGICSENEARGIDFFQGTEEPCEKYIPYLDAFHGRSFTATVWPVAGRGAVSIPLYIFLYHQYQISYAGWIDGGFSPSGFEKYGIGRSFIFGMYPGVRVGGNMQVKGNNSSDELKMLKGYVHFMKEASEFLIRGRMIGELQLKGSEPFNQEVKKGDKIPIKWNAVQGISWLSEKGDKVAYALTNLSEKSQTIQIELVKGNEALFKLSGYVLDKEQNQKGLKPDNGWLTITLQPWELAIVKTDE